MRHVGFHHDPIAVRVHDSFGEILCVQLSPDDDLMADDIDTDQTVERFHLGKEGSEKPRDISILDLCSVLSAYNVSWKRLTEGCAKG